MLLRDFDLPTGRGAPRRHQRGGRSHITDQNKRRGKYGSSNFSYKTSSFSSSNPLRWMFLALLILPETSASDVIRIGGLFDLADDGQEAAFKYAVNSVNSDRTVLGHVRLAALVSNVPFGDSFRGARKICSLVRSGVAAILGPQSDQTSAHVQSMCDALQIPHIENLWDFRLSGDSYSINLYPHPSTLAKAYIDVLKRLGWKKFCVIYDDTYGLIRVQELLKDQSFTSTLRQLPASRDYRSFLRDVKKTSITHLLLDLKRENIYSFLKQAQEVGLMTSYYNYFFTTFDLHTVGIEDFRHRGANMTSLRIIDPENPLVQRAIRDWFFGELRYGESYLPAVREAKRNNMTFLKTEMALMYDAVHLFAKALGDLDRSRPIEVARLDCEGDETWIYGNSLVNYMKWVQVRGLTGLIKFDAKGFRRDVTLDIVELTKTGLVKVGRWSRTSGANYTKSYREVEQGIVEDLRRKNLVISSVLEPPYVMLPETPDGEKGSQRLEGFCIDLIREISQILVFNYTVELADDGTYGRFDADSGRWNGMIGELLEQKADLAIGDLTITHERKQVVDFTVPWMNLGVSILYRKSSKKTSVFYRFLSPISADVWLSVASAYLVVSVMLFTIARFSPYEWTDTHQCDTSEGRINEFSLLGSFWFCFGSLVQQGGNALPRAISTRIIAGVWWFFTLIMISSYTANLTAFLMAERLETLVESVDDLAKSQIQYGTLNGGSTWNFFRTSKLAIYQKMFNFMESQTPTVYSTSNEEGVSNVLKGDGKYAYIMESPSIEYVTERHCDLIQVGGLLNSRSYSIALPPGSPYRTLINSALLKLQETGKLRDLKHKWWKVERGGGACQSSGDSGAASRAKELGLNSVGGVFVVLLAGMGLASITAVCEFAWKARRLSTSAKERDSRWNDVSKDLGLTLSCTSSTTTDGKVSAEGRKVSALTKTTYGSTYTTTCSFRQKELLS